MKKTLITIALALSASLSFAQGSEEICYETAKVNSELRRLFRESPDAFQSYLQKIEASVYPKRIKEKVKESAYWVKNNQDLPEDIFRKMAYLRCTMQF